ncbi:MAG: hypothetical protein V4685_13815 [Bacteroidota bacterium]
MKHKKLFFIGISSILLSCNSGEKTPATDIETAGAFMQDIWKMDFDKAEKLILKDETNNQVFSRFEQYMKAKPATELDKYRTAEFIINDTKPINDSVSIINYSGSFNKAEKTDLKLVRKNDRWLVDIKYTIPQTDSTQK